VVAALESSTATGSVEESAAVAPAGRGVVGACEGLGGARRIGRSYLWLPDDADISAGDKNAGSAGLVLSLQFTRDAHAAGREQWQEKGRRDDGRSRSRWVCVDGTRHAKPLRSLLKQPRVGLARAA
jgi:hypothetical protein